MMTRTFPGGETREGRPADRPARLVVGYDGSAAATAALRWAAEHAGAGATIVVVHAHHDGTPPAVAGAATARARAGLEDLWLHDDGLLAGIELELRVSDEPPAAALCMTAREIGADGIVVGTHDPSRSLATNVVRDLLTRSALPVTVVPARRSGRV